MPFRSPYPTAAVPEVGLFEYMFGDIGGREDRVALVDAASGLEYTYAAVKARALAVAAGLARRGLGKGEAVAILSPNHPDYVITVHGVIRAGGTITTMNPLYTEAEVHHQLEDSGARFFVTVPELLGKAQAAAAGTGVKEIFTIGAAEGATPFEALATETAAPPEVSFDVAEDVAAMLYSSGTTGLPKGVMLTHRNLVAALRQAGDLLGVGMDRSLLVLPIFHIFGFHAITNYDLWQGGTVVMMARFDMAQFLGNIEKHRIERVCLVPPIILGLVKSPLVDKYDLSSLRLVFSGAAPLDAELAAACERRIGCMVRQGYGLTETSPPVCGHPLDGEKVRHGSVGPLVGNTEGKLVDLATGEEAAPGQPGELWVRGPQVMKGYYNKPDANAITLVEGGWMRTGDIATIDEDNWITIVDRAKELIKFKGMQVAPAELEALLLTHPAIADTAVIGIPDEEAGEIPKAFIVRKDEITAEEVMAFVAGQVAPHKKIRQLEFVDAIPKSPSGKILRRVLRDHERARAAGAI